MVHPSAKASTTKIAAAINGRVRRHHRDMINYHWDPLMYLEEQIAKTEEQINQVLIPHREQIELLNTIPGVNEHAAATFIAEMGTDMSVFKSAKHLASWAGVSPGNNESAGKKTVKTIPGNKALKTHNSRICIGDNRTTDILILDELRFVPFHKDGSNLLFHLISDCYEHLSVIVTSNLEFSAWNTVFGDNQLTASLVDRLVHHAHILAFTGESYRLRHALSHS